ncbi:MAG TPA: response regulator transcription factor [Armatimonadota bacterium]|nr:response regulator transcription factor [Armatimonadota bacterium]
MAPPSPRVLVISADPAPAGQLHDQVVRLGGEVSHLHPGEFESRVSELRPPHVVILDAREATVDLKRLCALIRGRPRLREAAVLAVVPEPQLAGLDTSALDDFVAAPYPEGELRARLSRLFARVDEAPSASAVRMGELVLDPETYDVTVGGARVDLTLKEYHLLKHLVTHSGRVFTRDQLLDRVWGYDYVGGTRTVDVHIRRLRAKLGDVGETSIDTVRGVGYAFRPPRGEGV